MKKKVLLFVLIFLMIGTTTVYAYSNGLVKGVNNKTSEFNIEYQNVKSMSNNGNVYIDNNTGVTFNSNLQKPGDYYEFTVDLVNNGIENAKIDSILKTKLTKEQQRYLEYNVTYLNGDEIKQDDIIKSKETKTLKVRIEFKYDITVEDLPTEKENIDLSFNIVMVEA